MEAEATGLGESSVDFETGTNPTDLQSVSPNYRERRASNYKESGVQNMQAFSALGQAILDVYEELISDEGWSIETQVGFMIPTARIVEQLTFLGYIERGEALRIIALVLAS